MNNEIPSALSIEELKKKFGIDEKIARDLGKDQAEVERDYDPRLVRFLQDWMRKHKPTPI